MKLSRRVFHLIITSQENRIREETNPPARFDFSPFGGIHRPVQLVTTPTVFINKISVDTKIISR